MHEVEPRLGRRLLPVQVRAIRAPLRLHHLREAVDDDVKEGPDAKPDDRGGDSQPERRNLEKRQVFAQTAWPILKIGRYMATTMPPMRVPSTTMIIGSINDDSESTASSTSCS